MAGPFPIETDLLPHIFNATHVLYAPNRHAPHQEAHVGENRRVPGRTFPPTSSGLSRVE